MTHLSPEQLVDVADGCADERASAHAAACEACRAQVASILEAVRLAGTDPAPDPPPFFWPRLASRIGEAVRRERAPAAFWKSRAWRLAPVAAIAALVIAAGFGLRTWSGTPGGGPVAPATRDAAPLQAAGPAAGTDAPDDPSWLLVSALSADVSVEEAEASGALPLPGGVDRALAQLDDAERLELARILREEMAARGPAVPQGPGA